MLTRFVPILLLSLVAAAQQPSLEQRIDAYVRPYADSGNFSGVILIGKGDQVLLRKSYGMANYELRVPNTPKTRFHIASVSKSFTAAAILLLEQRGKLSVKDPLSQFIPDWPNGDRITVHHLLTHTSGIPNVNDLPDYDEKSRSQHSLQEILSWFRDKPLEMKPGERYSYSNSNYNLLAFIIEKVSGQSYGDFLRDNIFRPLGMNDTGHDADPAAIIPNRADGYSPAGLDQVENAPFLVWSIKTGNGSLYTTAEALHRWDRALYTDKLLNRAQRDKMFSEQVERVGYGWFIRKGQRRLVAINGRAPGFSANLDRFLDDQVCIVMLSNLYSSITHSMAPDIAAIYYGEERKPVLPLQAIKLDRKILASYTGEYQFGPDFRYNPNGRVRVQLAEAGLLIDNNHARSFLIPLAENKFLDRAYGGTVTFMKDSSGRITELTHSWGADETYKASRKNP